MFIATSEIGKYKKGDVVSQEDYDLYKKMYLSIPISFVPDKVEENKEENKPVMIAKKTISKIEGEYKINKKNKR